MRAGSTPEAKSAPASELEAGVEVLRQQEMELAKPRENDFVDTSPGHELGVMATSLTLKLVEKRMDESFEMVRAVLQYVPPQYLGGECRCWL
jgi:hypothetical protein